MSSRAPQTSAYRPLDAPCRTPASCRLFALRPRAFSPRRVLTRLPAYPPAVLAAVVANVCFDGMLNAHNLPAARGKVIAIEIRDAGVRLAFTIEGDGIIACRSAKPDATISADARDFFALARGTQDADALFFGRRLVMEGDTEFALLIRNTLDALDFQSLKPPRPARVLDAIALQVRSFRRKDQHGPASATHQSAIP